MKNVLKLKDSSKPAESKQKDDVLELYMDYVGDDGYVYKHNGKEYYRTNISLQGPKGNPGPKGRDGLTPNIGQNGNWYIGGKDTQVKAALNTDEYVTKEELEDVIGNVPETLDTLKELADSLGNDANFATHVNNSINELKENLTFTETTDPTNNGHEYVEIGGIKWATMNIGAKSETDYGLYFQWGDTQGYTADQVGSGEGQKSFGLADYKYGNGTSVHNMSMTKYNNTDGKTVLDLEDDAVRANWGGGWRMPTNEELLALGNAVNAVWTTDYNGSGINGLLCTDKTDDTKTLFFPADGYASASNNYDGRGMVYYMGDDCAVWSSSLYVEDTYANRAYGLTVSTDRDSYFVGDTSRHYGFSVRGVLDDTEAEPTTTTYTANRVVIPIDSSKNAATNKKVINANTVVPYITDIENYLVIKESENLHSGTVIVEANLSGKGLCCSANIIYEQNKYYIYPSLPLDNIKDNLKDLILYCYQIEDYVAPTAVAHKLWFDDFPEDKLDDIIGANGQDNWEDFVAYLVNNVNKDGNRTGANGYIYTGETFNWNGSEYYLWETDGVNSTVVPYIITDTIDYNELYPNSLEADSSNKYCPYVAMLTDDMEAKYTRSDEHGDILIKVEQ